MEFIECLSACNETHTCYYDNFYSDVDLTSFKSYHIETRVIKICLHDHYLIYCD